MFESNIPSVKQNLFLRRDRALNCLFNTAKDKIASILFWLPLTPRGCEWRDYFCPQMFRLRCNLCWQKPHTPGLQAHSRSGHLRLFTGTGSKCQVTEQSSRRRLTPEITCLTWNVWLSVGARGTRNTNMGLERKNCSLSKTEKSSDQEILIFSPERNYSMLILRNNLFLSFLFFVFLLCHAPSWKWKVDSLCLPYVCPHHQG